MRASILAAAASLAKLASARVNSIAVPVTVAPGFTFDLTVITENYIQSVQDVSITYGIASGVITPYPGTLGVLLGSSYLGPDKSNTIDNITVSVTLPENTEKGEGVFAASLYSLYGARYGGVITNFNVSVTVGDETSEELKRSEGSY